MNGFLSVIKPLGMSSGKVVGTVKRLLNGEKIGHGGTLDPQAEGVLPIMIGRATRLFDYLVDKRKEYIAEIAFGSATDTQDAQGEIICKGNNYPTVYEVNNVLPGFIGTIMQKPPVYSAIHINGRRAYDMARKGEVFEISARSVEVFGIECLSETQAHGMMLKICCGKGTYIRALCNDIGEATGCPAHMRSLCRTRSGYFSVENAYTIEELTEAAEKNRLGSMLIRMDEPFGNYPAINVPVHFDKQCRNGGLMLRSDFTDLDGVSDSLFFRMYLSGEFMGMGELCGERVVLRTMVAGNSEL